MGFQTPQFNIKKYLEWTTSGSIQLPDFQRSYRWKDEGVRQLLITVLRGHPMGVVMLLDTKNDEVRFKPRPVTGVNVGHDVAPENLLLDGQQRLTSLTQAFTGDGIVQTSDDRGKLLDRRYFVHIETILLGEDRVEDAVAQIGDRVPAQNPRDGSGRDAQLGAEPVLAPRYWTRMVTMASSVSTGICRGQWRGRDDRSWRPGQPSSRKRVIQRCAHWRETPWALAAWATAQPCSQTRSTSSCRPRALSRALRWDTETSRR